MFFFEKKNQKTFGFGLRPFSQPECTGFASCGCLQYRGDDTNRADAITGSFGAVAADANNA